MSKFWDTVKGLAPIAAGVGGFVAGGPAGAMAAYGGSKLILDQFGNPVDDAQAAEQEAGQQKIDAMRKASAEIAKYRPIVQQNIQNGMGQQAHAYDGVAQQLRGMYGAGAAPVPNLPGFAQPGAPGGGGGYMGPRAPMDPTATGGGLAGRAAQPFPMGGPPRPQFGQPPPGGPMRLPQAPPPGRLQMPTAPRQPQQPFPTGNSLEDLWRR